MASRGGGGQGRVRPPSVGPARRLASQACSAPARCPRVPLRPHTVQPRGPGHTGRGWGPGGADRALSFSQALASPLGTSLCHLFMNLVSPDPPRPRTPSQAQAASQGGGQATGYTVTVPASQPSGCGDWQQDDVMTSLAPQQRPCVGVEGRVTDVSGAVVRLTALEVSLGTHSWER